MRGQANVARATGRITGVRLVPEHPTACPEAVEAVREADWVVLGPGSWYTSVLPHLLVPELAEALVRTTARRCLVYNLVASAGETAGMSAPEHLAVLSDHGPAPVRRRRRRPLVDRGRRRHGRGGRRLGARLVLRQVGTAPGSARHDPLRLAAALRDVLEHSWGDV